MSKHILFVLLLGLPIFTAQAAQPAFDDATDATDAYVRFGDAPYIYGALHNDDRPTPQNKQLIDAAAHDDVPALEEALLYGAYINFRADRGGNLHGTALLVAVRHRAINAIEFLCKKGINIFLWTPYEQDALQLAATMHYYDLLVVLVDGIRSQGHINADLQTFLKCDMRLFKAIYADDMAAFDLLLDQGCSVNTQIPGLKVTPIMLACQMGRSNMVRKLARYGACFDKHALISLAAQFGREAVVADLLKGIDHRILTGECNFGVDTPLYLALRNKHYATAMLIARHMRRLNADFDVYTKMFSVDIPEAQACLC